MVILYGKGCEFQRMHDMLCRSCKEHDLEYYIALTSEHC